MRGGRLGAPVVRVLCLLVVSAILTGCLWRGNAGAADTISLAPPTAAVAAAPAPSAAAADGSAYRQLEAVVARIRGLEPTQEVALRFMSQQELHRYFADAFDREYSPEERQRDQQLLVTLGLLDPSQDLTALMLDLLSEQVIGFYDEETRAMYLIGDVVQPTAASKVTFVHEFTHALQDEHFGLHQLNPPDSDNDDRSAAIQALVEGDATLVMFLYLRNELSPAERREYARSQLAGDSGSLDRAPLVLREELLFPYQAGLRFVQSLERQGGFAAVDAAFRDPPQSTEQVLHPEKYRAREAPVQVELPDLAAALGGGWRQTVANVLGELDLRILVEQFTDSALAERAAAGWGGDRYALLQSDDGRAAVVVKTVWDTPLDAQEFFDAYQLALRNRYGAATRSVLGGSDRLVIAGDGFAASTALRGQEVLIVLAPDESVRTTLAQLIEGS